MNNFSLPLHFGKLIIGSHGGDSKPESDIPRYLKLVKERRLDLSQLISKRYPLFDINQAIEDMKNGHTAGRVLLIL